MAKTFSTGNPVRRRTNEYRPTEPVESRIAKLKAKLGSSQAVREFELRFQMKYINQQQYA